MTKTTELRQLRKDVDSLAGLVETISIHLLTQAKLLEKLASAVQPEEKIEAVNPLLFIGNKKIEEERK